MWLMSKVQHTHIWSPRSKERNWVEAVFGKIIVKSFQTDERHQLTDSRSSVNPQKGLKNNHIYTRHSQTVKNRRQILYSSHREKETKSSKKLE